MYLFRCHSLAEEPTEKKKKSSQALQQAIFTLIFRILILSLGGFPLRLNGVGKGDRRVVGKGVFAGIL